MNTEENSTLLSANELTSDNFNVKVIKAWDRRKYPSFQEYLGSEEYEKWLDQESLK